MANQLATRDACSEGRAQACTCGCANAVEEVAEGRIEAGSGIFTCCRAAIGEKYARKCSVRLCPQEHQRGWPSPQVG